MESKIVKIYGECRTLAEWAAMYEISRFVMNYRYNAGFRGEELLAPVGKDTMTEDKMHEMWGGKWKYVGANLSAVDKIIKKKKEKQKRN